jgi:hypothetical protein
MSGAPTCCLLLLNTDCASRPASSLVTSRPPTMLTRYSTDFRLFSHKRLLTRSLFLAHQPFGNLVPAQYYIQMCKDAYGSSLPLHILSVKLFLASTLTSPRIPQCRQTFCMQLVPVFLPLIRLVSARYGGNNYSVSGPSEIFFVNGAGDPWHMLSITPQLAQGNPNLYVSLLFRLASSSLQYFPDCPDRGRGRPLLQRVILCPEAHVTVCCLGRFACSLLL